MKKFKCVAVAILAAGFVSGCAIGYQPQSFTGGYSDIQFNSDTYQITVKGNGYTSPERAQNIALLRAAELAKNAGYHRFVLLNGGVSNQYAGSTPVTVNAIGGTVIASGGEPVLKPSGGFVIRMVKPDDPSYATAMDAELIYSQLRPRFGQP